MPTQTSPTMKALRFYKQGDIRLDDVDRAFVCSNSGTVCLLTTFSSCQPDEVRLKVAYCGMCGTDIHEFLAGPILMPLHGETNEFSGANLPITMGHEMSGTVVEVGNGVQSFKVGQKVTVNPAMDERHHGMDACSMCNQGKHNICARSTSYGLSAPGGGFSEEIVVKALNCIAVPDNVSLKVAALTEPLAVAWHCIETSGFQKGQSALVAGAGPIGLAILLLLRVLGASRVVVTEVTATRTEQAKQFGADLVINPLHGSQQKIVAQIDELCEDGVDVAFDATGLQSTLDLSIASTKAGGTIFNVAIHEKPLLINPNDLAKKEKKFTGGICYNNKDFEAVLHILAQGKIAAEKLITSIVPLSNIIKGGFEELINNKAAHVKILIQPDLV